MKNFLTRFGSSEQDIKPSSLSAGSNLFLVILFGIFLVAGCSKIGKFLPEGGGSSTNTNQSPTDTNPASAPIDRALQITQPRAFKYANLQYTVTKAVISVRVADDLPIDNSKPAVADVTFSVVNMAKEGVTIRNGQWQLKLGDGSVYKRPYEDNLQPRDTQVRKISFHVPESSQWAGAQISLDEQDKEPATMMLDGNAQPQQYPITLPATGEKTTKDPTITYAIQSANLDMDGFSQRAALGKRYLNLTVHITCKDGGNEFVPEFFRLLINGAPSIPENTSDNTVLSCPSSQDYVMSYVIPASAAAVELEVGRMEVQKTETIQIDLKQ